MTDSDSEYAYPIVGASFFLVKLRGVGTSYAKRAALLDMLYWYYKTDGSTAIIETYEKVAIAYDSITYILDYLYTNLEIADGSTPFTSRLYVSSTLTGPEQFTSLQLSYTTAFSNSFSYNLYYSATETDVELDICNSSTLVATFGSGPAVETYRLSKFQEDCRTLPIFAFGTSVRLYTMSHSRLLHATGVAIVHNLGLSSPLQLSASTLASIFLGTVQYWNDSSILALNPSLVTELNSAGRIIVVARNDSTVVNEILSGFLSQVDTSFGTSIGVTLNLVSMIPENVDVKLVNSERDMASAMFITSFAPNAIGYTLLSDSSRCAKVNCLPASVTRTVPQYKQAYSLTFMHSSGLEQAHLRLTDSSTALTLNETSMQSCLITLQNSTGAYWYDAASFVDATAQGCWPLTTVTYYSVARPNGFSPNCEVFNKLTEYAKWSVNDTASYGQLSRFGGSNLPENHRSLIADVLEEFVCAEVASPTPQPTTASSDSSSTSFSSFQYAVIAFFLLSVGVVMYLSTDGFKSLKCSKQDDGIPFINYLQTMKRAQGVESVVATESVMFKVPVTPAQTLAEEHIPPRSLVEAAILTCAF
jgi:hypothetical protein